MKRSRFEELFGNNRTICTASPEWRFMNCITEGRIEEAVSLFGTRRCYGKGELCIDTPYGRFEGLDAIETMAQGWLEVFHAASARMIAVAQTRAGSRAITEMVLHYETADGEAHVIPMAAVAEVKANGQMDELRLYFHWRSAPGLPAYRPPIFPERADRTNRQEMVSGAIGDYLRLLHDPNGGIIAHAGDVFSDAVCFGGYDPHDLRDDFGPVERTKFVEHLAGEIGHTLSTYVQLGIEAITDDGKTCCIEWEQLVTKAGREEAGRISQAGIALYERDELGRIWSARIIDYAYSERFIDWSTARVPKERALAWNYLGE